MKQALHIFRKDVGHLWPELSILGMMLVAFCVVTPQTWAGSQSTNPMLSVASQLLKVLLPVMWLVLTARVVQEERLVGDQQFWLTRPYEWGSLLGAKALFVVVFVVLPFVAAQWLLLLVAGLHPWADWTAMGLTVARMAIVLWLPFFAIAAVTQNIPRTFLVVLGVIMAWAGMLAVFGRAPGTSAPYAAEVVVAVTGVLLLGSVIYVYATREIKQARWALVGTLAMFFVLLGCLLGMFFPAITRVLVQHHYAVDANSPLRLVFHPEQGNGRPANQSESSHDEEVLVRLPLKVEGLQESEHLHDPNVAYTLDAGGYHYASPWRSALVDEDGVTVLIPGNVYERVRGGAVQMHVSLAVELLRVAETQTVQARAEFGAPEGGDCILAADRVMNNLVCRYAYHMQTPTWITTEVTPGKCGGSVVAHPAGAALRLVPAGVGPDPVVEQAIALGGRVCANTPVTFRVSKAVANLRMETEMAAMDLTPFVLH
jgi:hypothetical protein